MAVIEFGPVLVSQDASLGLGECNQILCLETSDTYNSFLNRQKLVENAPCKYGLDCLKSKSPVAQPAHF